MYHWVWVVIYLPEADVFTPLGVRADRHLNQNLTGEVQEGIDQQVPLNKSDDTPLLIAFVDLFISLLLLCFEASALLLVSDLPEFFAFGLYILLKACNLLVVCFNSTF